MQAEQLQAIYDVVVNGNFNILPLSACGSAEQILEISSGKFVCIVFAHGYFSDSNYDESYYTFNASITGEYETIVPLSDYQMTKTHGITSTKYMIIKKEENETITVNAKATANGMHIIAFVIS